MLQKRKGPIVVILVTALRDEYEQVLKVDEGAIDRRWQEGPGLDDRLVGTRRFRTASGIPLQVVATWATEMGGVATAALATSLIDKYHPQCISMCGICAGRSGKLSLGDVIFADRLWSYDTGKLVVEVGPNGERVEHFSGDTFQYRLPERWKQRVEAYKVGDAKWLKLRPLSLQSQAEWLLIRLLDQDDPRGHKDRKSACPDWASTISYLRKKNLLKKTGLSLTQKGVSVATDLALLHPEGLPHPEEFRFHLAPIATGNQVVEDPAIFERLAISMRKVLGVEMEASALGAVGDLKEVPVIVAKGVSDFASDKDDRFRTFASRASAECLIRFLRGNLPELLRHPSAALGKGINNEILRERPNLLPRDVATFTGRTAHLRRLINELTPKSKTSTHSPAVAIDAIDGMAGIGKTALAVHVAHRIAPYYPDAQLFIELHGYTPGREPVTAGDALDRLLRALGVPPARIPEDLDERAALWRAEIAGLRALVVLDNANSHEQVRSLLPGLPGCCVLITSRRRLASLEGVRQLSLDLLPEKEAVALFRRIVGGGTRVSVSADALRRLVKLCGYLPLAIQLVGNRWRHRPAWSLEDLMEKLADTSTRLKVISAESVEIATAFELSYKGLNTHQQRLFRRLGLHPGIDITPEAAAALTNEEIRRVEGWLDELFDHSLINEPERARYRFHDLLRDYARDRAAQEESRAERNSAEIRLLEYYVKSLDFADRLLEPHRRRLNLGQTTTPPPGSRPNNHREAFLWLEAERLNALACARLAAEMGENLIVWKLADRLAHFLLNSGYNADAFELHQAAWTAAKAIGDLRLEASSLTDLAQSCQASGKFEIALKYFGQSLELWVRAEDDEGRARTLTGIGFTLERTGEYKEALVNLNEALRIRRVTLDAYGEGHVLNTIGAVYWRLHEYAKALHNFHKALLIRRDIKDRYGEARTVNNIGFTYQRLGKYKKARKWLLDALAIAQDLGDRNSEAVTLNNLGYTLEREGDFQAALSYAKKGLETARIIGSLYEEGRAMDAMARCAAGNGDKKTAKEYWKSAINLFEKAGVPEAKDLQLTLEGYA